MNNLSKLAGLALLCISMNTTAQKMKKKRQSAENQSEASAKPAEILTNPEDAFFLEIFKKYPGVFDSVLAHLAENKVQIIYTQINRDKKNNPLLKQYYFNRQGAKYHYPASTVKLPLALLALEKLQKLNSLGIDKYSTIITDAEFSGQTPQFNEPNSPDGKPTIANYIKQLLMVSDNNAAIRLYEFLGQKYINDQLKQKGFKGTQILHRLDRVLSEDENRHTNPVKFLDSVGKILYAQPMQYNKEPYEKRNDFIGQAYYSSGQLVNRPMSFSAKNRFPLQELATVLQSIVFPATVDEKQRFAISEADRLFLLKYMSQLPGESIYPYYTDEYYDAYCKFLLYGSEEGALPKNIRIFNKIGDAYGHLIDAAYIVDFDKNIEFMLSAVIYCNSDGVLNDDKYDYDTVGFPFMKNLGKALYDYEVKRKRENKPDLSEFKFVYDK